jgi:hypothetical protein
MWSVHIFWDARSEELREGTGRGEVVKVVWRREASSSGRGVDTPLLVFGREGAVWVILVVSADVVEPLDFSNEGAVLARDFWMPCAVSSDVVSCSNGGVTAIGAMLSLD